MARQQQAEPKPSRRQKNRAWKRIYGVDRAYTRRVDAARARGQFTPSPKSEEAV